MKRVFRERKIRTDDQVQKLRDLSLESEAFSLCGHFVMI